MVFRNIPAYKLVFRCVPAYKLVFRCVPAYKLVFRCIPASGFSKHAGWQMCFGFRLCCEVIGCPMLHGCWFPNISQQKTTKLLWFEKPKMVKPILRGRIGETKNFWFPGCPGSTAAQVAQNHASSRLPSDPRPAFTFRQGNGENKWGFISHEGSWYCKGNITPLSNALCFPNWMARNFITWWSSKWSHMTLKPPSILSIWHFPYCKIRNTPN